MYRLSHNSNVKKQETNNYENLSLWINNIISYGYEDVYQDCSNVTVESKGFQLRFFIVYFGLKYWIEGN